MIRHVAMFTLLPDAPADTPERLAEALAALPGAIPAIAAYTFGADLGLREGTWDFAVVADFETEADFRTYADHPAHQAFIREKLQPVLADRASIQFER